MTFDDRTPDMPRDAAPEGRIDEIVTLADYPFSASQLDNLVSEHCGTTPEIGGLDGAQVRCRFMHEADHKAFVSFLKTIALPPREQL